MNKQEILEASAKLVEYSAAEAGLAELRKDLAGVQFDVTTTEGNKAARAARSRCVSIRTSADAAYKDWNQPILKKQKAMRVRLEEIEKSVKEVEEPIDEQIKVEEKRKAEEKAKRERIEAEKQKALQDRIDAIKFAPSVCAGQNSGALAGAIEALQLAEITPDEYGDRAGEAEIAKQQTLEQLEQLHAVAVKYEAEQAQLAADRAELARQQTEQAKAAAEARRIEDQRLADERAELAQKQAAQAKATADAKKLADAQEAERQAAHDKQQAELKAQQDAIDRQKQELADAKAAAERKEQQRLDDIEAEAQARRDAEAKAAQDKANAEAAAAKKKADDEAAEAARRKRAQFEKNGPGDVEIVRALAEHYRVCVGDVMQWLAKFDYAAADEQLAAANV